MTDDELIERRLLELCLDWDGSTMPDGAEARVPVTCGDIRTVASRITELKAALKSADAWLERWAVHVGNCEGGLRCTCGLTAISHEVAAALSQGGEE